MTQITATAEATAASVTHTFRSTSNAELIDILILGAGWTSTFLIPLLEQSNITHAATSRNGHDHTIPFQFDPDSHNLEPFESLPPAMTILVTFPLKGQGQSRLLTDLYEKSHEDIQVKCQWIQLGSTGIFTENGWNDSGSRYDKGNARAIAEDELLHINGGRACVLNLAGLYGGERLPRNWITRVAKTKEDVKGKGALHLVHGRDVARAVIGAHRYFQKVGNHRWIVTDLHTYDWWDLIHAWGGYARETVVPAQDLQEEKDLQKGREVGKYLQKSTDEAENEKLQYERWVIELMEEENVKALPRDTDRLGRVLDGRGFWQAVEGAPKEGRVS